MALPLGLFRPGLSLLCGVAVAAVAAAALTDRVGAQEFPSQELTIIVPWPAGGGADTSARLLADPMGRHLGVDVVVRNVEGAGSMTGMAALWRADPDGHTVGLTYVQHTVANQIFETPPYQVEEYGFVSQFAVTMYKLAVPTDSEFETLDDLVNSERPIRFCVPSAIGTEALTALSFGSETGAEIALVTGYGGAAPAILGAMRGECDAVNFGSALRGAIEAGDLKPLLAYDTEPNPWFPDLATLTDVGMSPDIAHLGVLNFVMWAPPGTPEDRLAILEEALEKASAEVEDDLYERWLAIRRLSSDEVGPMVSNVFRTYSAAADLLE